MLVIHLLPVSSITSFNPEEYETTREFKNKDDISLLETNKGWMAVPACKHDIKLKDVKIISKRIISRSQYDELTNGERKQFSPNVDSISETSGTATADGFWMVLNWMISALPFSQGNTFADYGPWEYTGITMATAPVVVTVVAPTVTALRYRYSMKHWPNGSEVSDVVVSSLKSTVKYALGVFGWCMGFIIGSIAMPALFHSLGLASSVFAGPAGYIAIAACIGIGAGLGLAAYHAGLTVVEHFFERTPESKNQKGVLKNIVTAFNPHSYHKKHDRGPFDWKGMGIGAIKEFATGFVGGIVWYAASLIPGGLAAIPISSMASQVATIMMKIAAAVVAAVAAVIGSAAVSDITAKLFYQAQTELPEQKRVSTEKLLSSLVVSSKLEKTKSKSDVVISAPVLVESKSKVNVSREGLFAHKNDSSGEKIKHDKKHKTAHDAGVMPHLHHHKMNAA